MTSNPNPSPAILMSIRPKWCQLIANGKKTIEIRKTRPRLETPFKVYIYCTQGTPFWLFNERFESEEKANGKVIGEFMCNSITELAPINRSPEDTEERACLTREEIVQYVKGKGYAWHISDLVVYEKPRRLSEFYRPEMLSFSALGDELCAYCKPTDYGEKSSCCEGKFCNEAYDQYIEENMITSPPQSWAYTKEES